MFDVQRDVLPTHFRALRGQPVLQPFSRRPRVKPKTLKNPNEIKLFQRNLLRLLLYFPIHKRNVHIPSTFCLFALNPSEFFHSAFDVQCSMFDPTLHPHFHPQRLRFPLQILYPENVCAHDMAVKMG